MTVIVYYCALYVIRFMFGFGMAYFDAIDTVVTLYASSCIGFQIDRCPTVLDFSDAFVWQYSCNIEDVRLISVRFSGQQ